MLLKFVWGQTYNGKLALRYGHAPTDACPLPGCGLPDSCTHIAGECKAQKANIISRHNAACQIVHAAVRNAAKGGGALHSALDLVLVMADMGTQPQLTPDIIASITSTQEELGAHPNRTTHSPEAWMPPPTPSAEQTRRRRHTDVSQDPRCLEELTLFVSLECTGAPHRIPPWILPVELATNPRPSLTTDMT